MITAKKLKCAAASVRGARSAGIETQAAKEAPALLEKAREVLARLEEKAAEDQLCDFGGAAHAKYVNFSKAVEELQAALEEKS